MKPVEVHNIILADIICHPLEDGLQEEQQQDDDEPGRQVGDQYVHSTLGYKYTEPRIVSYVCSAGHWTVMI